MANVAPDAVALPSPDPTSSTRQAPDACCTSHEPPNLTLWHCRKFWMLLKNWRNWEFTSAHDNPKKSNPDWPLDLGSNYFWVELKQWKSIWCLPSYSCLSYVSVYRSICNTDLCVWCIYTVSQGHIKMSLVCQTYKSTSHAWDITLATIQSTAAISA